MFRLDNILEDWAAIYSPLSYDPETRKSFFRMSLIDEESYFIRNFASMPSPCVAFPSHVDGTMIPGDPKSMSYTFRIYFLVKQENERLKTNLLDEVAATEARYRTDAMVQDLLNFLSALIHTAGSGSLPSEAASLPDKLRGYILRTSLDDPANRAALRGFRLTEAQWDTIPAKFGGWQICCLTIEQRVPRNICIDPGRYKLE